MDARDRMENVLEYIINITMEINFSSKVYSKRFTNGLLQKVYSKRFTNLRSRFTNFDGLQWFIRNGG